MSVWDKVREGIDKAGKAAQDAFDEGKTRLEAYRAREQADKSAEALGYAVFRALEAGKELDPESRDRLMRSLRERDAEARRLETELANGGRTPPTPAPAQAPTQAPVDAAPAPDASAPFTAPPSTEV
jgi:hypothetical protein